MSTQQAPTFVPIDPNDPRLHTPDEGYRRLRSQRIFELDANLASKSKEHDDCGKTAESLGCNRHDITRIIEEKPRTCKQRFSRCCGPRITANRMEKNERIIQTIMTMTPPCDWPERIKLITVTIPMARDRDAIKDFIHRLWKATKRLCEDAVHNRDNGSYYAKPCTKGFDGSRLVTQIPFWASYISPERIRAAFAKLGEDVGVTVYERHNDYAEEIFREAFEIIVPLDPIEQAELEVLFNKVDLMTTYEYGLDELGLDAWESVGEVDLIPSNTKEPVEGINAPHDPLDCDTCHTSLLPSCPDCGKEANVRSGLHRLHAPAVEVHRSGWRKLFG